MTEGPFVIRTHIESARGRKAAMHSKGIGLRVFDTRTAAQDHINLRGFKLFTEIVPLAQHLVEYGE